MEIDVDGPRGTGTLAATIMVDQPRAAVTSTLGIAGPHGCEWLIPTRYQTGHHRFSVEAVDTTPHPNWRTPLNTSPRTGP